MDQGREGACVGFGMSHELIARPAEVMGITSKDARRIYKAAQRIDPWPGENYEGTSVLAGIQVTQALGYFDSYRWAFGADETIRGIGYHGPAVLGTRVYEGMMTPRPDGQMKLSGRVLGGHCYLANRVDVKNGRIWIVNSWGTDWGVNGTAYFTFDDFRRLMQREGEAAFMLGRKTYSGESFSAKL
jgi:hypothetical protein